MKKYLRLLAVLTLGAYMSLVVTEIFHNLCRHHDESHCVVCQVVHQTPVISQGKPVATHQENFSRIAAIAAPITLAEEESVYHGLSPPIA